MLLTDYMNDLHLKEITWIQGLQEIRSSLLDYLFLFLDFFDRQECYFVILPAVWLGYNWKWGLRLTYLFLINGCLIHFLKKFFLEPRPFHLDPSLGIIQVKGYGFPSGGASAAILLGAIIIYSWRTPWGWILGLSYFFWVSLARVYLGLHFPSDLMGGWLVGISLFFLFIYVREPIERFLEKRSWFLLLIFSQLVPILLAYTFYKKPFTHLTAAVMGIGMGSVISLYKNYMLPDPKSWGKAIVRGLLGVVGTFSIYFSTFYIPEDAGRWLAVFSPFFLMGLWISLIAPFLIRHNKIDKIEKMNRIGLPIFKKK